MKYILLMVLLLSAIFSSGQVKKAYTPTHTLHPGDTLECVMKIQDTRKSTILRHVDTTEHIVQAYEVRPFTGLSIIFLDTLKRRYPKYIKITKL